MELSLAVCRAEHAGQLLSRRNFNNPGLAALGPNQNLDGGPEVHIKKHSLARLTDKWAEADDF
jgi:hypothetical protein